MSYRPSASEHTDAFTPAELVGVTLNGLHLAVGLRDNEADMAVSISSIDEKQMTGLDLIGVTSRDLKRKNVVGIEQAPQFFCVAVPSRLGCRGRPSLVVPRQNRSR